jgi:hypothetical protein
LFWYYSSPLLLCKWGIENMKLQVQFFSKWAFRFFLCLFELFFIVYVCLYVFCEHVCVWIFLVYGIFC